MDEHTDDVELTGNTHLEPSYRPEWGNSNPDWEDGQVHLEGELDFPADQPAREVAESLIERSEQIGALVSHDETSGHIEAYPWNGPGYFRLCYDVDDVDARVTEIVVFDGDDEPADRFTMDELKKRGEFTQQVKENLTPADPEDDGQVYRITTDGLQPVEDDEE